jgi:hypothetical protein
LSLVGILNARLLDVPVGIDVVAIDAARIPIVPVTLVLVVMRVDAMVVTVTLKRPWINPVILARTSRRRKWRRSKSIHKNNHMKWHGLAFLKASF